MDNLDFDSRIKISAKRVIDNKRVHASEVTKKDGPFYCPDTYEELIVRKCIEKTDHFAYKARMSPVASKESGLHKDCKDELLEALVMRIRREEFHFPKRSLLHS